MARSLMVDGSSLPNSFDDVTDLRCRSVHQNTDAIDLCGQDTNSNGRADQDRNRNGDLIPRYCAHSDPRTVWPALVLPIST